MNPKLIELINSFYFCKWELLEDKHPSGLYNNAIVLRTPGPDEPIEAIKAINKWLYENLVVTHYCPVKWETLE